MNKRILSLIVTLLMISLSIFISTGQAAESLSNDNIRVQSNDPGHKWEIPTATSFTKSLETEAEAVTEQYPEASLLNTNILIDRGNVQLELMSNHSDIYTGAYTDENGKNVILVTELPNELKSSVMSTSVFPQNIEYLIVKYSLEELTKAKESLSGKMKELGLEAVGINPKLNKVNVYISQEQYDNAKEEILNYIDEDMVRWVIGELSLQTQAYNLFPGEKIERGTAITSPACSLGFNGRANGNNVGVTAGHCENGTWYDLSDGSSPIGTMNNAVFSDTSKFDAGYIVYNSSVNPSHNLNGNSLTIGTTDYSGLYRQVGDKVRVHGYNLNGSSYPLAEIVDTSYDINGGPTDMIITGLSGTQLGDSGGLVYNVVNNGVRNYARIEGTHTGIVRQGGVDTWQAFSKYSYTISSLGLSGVYTDSSY